MQIVAPSPCSSRAAPSPPRRSSSRGYPSARRRAGSTGCRRPRAPRRRAAADRRRAAPDSASCDATCRRARALRARASCARRLPCRRYVSGSSTFSNTVRSPIRLNAWKMNPISRLRMRARSRRVELPDRRAVQHVRPPLGVSSRPRIDSNVVLPQPDGPEIDSTRPCRLRSARRRARASRPRRCRTPSSSRRDGSRKQGQSGERLRSSLCPRGKPCLSSAAGSPRNAVTGSTVPRGARGNTQQRR